jgi:GNAT superfamily N-acetyltransferase
MDAQSQIISVHDAQSFSDYAGYLSVVVRSGKFFWIFYSFLLFLKNSRLAVIKDKGTVIGGFFTTDFPLVKYKPYNWLNREVSLKVSELKRMGYRGLCCFIVLSEYRSRGIGTQVFRSYFKDNKMKIYFTSSPKARTFYSRNGAKVILHGMYDMYTFNPLES